MRGFGQKIPLHHQLADLPLLSYDFGSFYANLEQLRSTSFMPGNGGGWTVPLLVVEDRR